MAPTSPLFPFGTQLWTELMSVRLTWGPGAGDLLRKGLWFRRDTCLERAGGVGLIGRGVK